MEKIRDNPLIMSLCILGKVLFASILAAIILSLFCLAYYHTGLRIKCESESTDYHWEPDTFMSTMKEGYAWIKIDENGYNNVSVPERIDVLVMGSSHMEAAQVSQNENTVSHLNRLLPDMVAYNIGISGHTIYRCVDNVESAIDSYLPFDFVVIETNKIRLNIDEMEAVIEGNGTKEIASSTNALMTVIQKIPIFKPLYTQVGAWRAQDSSSDSDSEVNNTSVYNEEHYRQVLMSFLEIVGNAASEYGIHAIIFYDPPQEFSDDGKLDYFHTYEDIALFQDACDKNNITFVDMTDTFDAAYREENILAHGFINTGVGIGHLNSNGHLMIAEVIADIILNFLNNYHSTV